MTCGRTKRIFEGGGRGDGHGNFDHMAPPHVEPSKFPDNHGPRSVDTLDDRECKCENAPSDNH